MTERDTARAAREAAALRANLARRKAQTRSRDDALAETATEAVMPKVDASREQTG